MDVFAVGPDGRLSASPTVNSLPGDVPFAVAFDQAGHVVLAEAGPNAVATFTLSRGGDADAARRRGHRADGDLLGGAGRRSTSTRPTRGAGRSPGTASAWSGGLTALGNTTTDAGTVDAASAAGGRFVYVQTGKAGIVDEFAVGAGGALTPIGSVTVPGGAGGEGIAAA